MKTYAQFQVVVCHNDCCYENNKDYEYSERDIHIELDEKNKNYLEDHKYMINHDDNEALGIDIKEHEDAYLIEEQK